MDEHCWRRHFRSIGQGRFAEISLRVAPRLVSYLVRREVESDIRCSEHPVYVIFWWMGMFA